MITFSVKRRASGRVGRPATTVPILRRNSQQIGENRAELDHDVEGFRLRVGEIQQTARDDQMPRARHRQKLGQAFHDAQNQRLAISIQSIRQPFRCF